MSQVRKFLHLELFLIQVQVACVQSTVGIFMFELAQKQQLPQSSAHSIVVMSRTKKKADRIIKGRGHRNCRSGIRESSRSRHASTHSAVIHTRRVQR